MSQFSMTNALITRGLTVSERLVYAYIVARGNGAHVCWPSVRDMRVDLELSRKTVLNSTKKLAERGLIRVEKRYKDTNNYFVVDVPGLYDSPLYPSATLRPDFPWHQQGESAGESEVQKTTPKTPESEVQKTTPKPLSGAKNDVLGCKKRLSRVQNMTPESVYIMKEGTKNPASRARERTPAGDADFVPVRRDASLDERLAIGAPLPGWTWNPSRSGYEKPLPVPKSTAAYVAAMGVIGSPAEDGSLCANGYDVAAVVKRVCEIAGMDYDRATGKDFAIVADWLHHGIESPDILAAIERRVSREDYERAYSLRYFDTPVRSWRAPKITRARQHTAYAEELR